MVEAIQARPHSLPRKEPAVTKETKPHHFYECSICKRRIPVGSERMVEGKKKFEYVFVCKESCKR